MHYNTAVSPKHAKKKDAIYLEFLAQDPDLLRVRRDDPYPPRDAVLVPGAGRPRPAEGPLEGHVDVDGEARLHGVAEGAAPALPRLLPRREVEEHEGLEDGVLRRRRTTHKQQQQRYGVKKNYDKREAWQRDRGGAGGKVYTSASASRSCDSELCTK